ncbi:MAG: hypothetical protein WBG92_05835 [Thiohalocapsa sp.]
MKFAQIDLYVIESSLLAHMEDLVAGLVLHRRISRAVEEENMVGLGELNADTTGHLVIEPLLGSVDI